MSDQQYQEPTQESLYGSADMAGTNRAEVAAQRKAAMREIIIGALIALVGIAITVVTYKMAEDGGRYVVTWGLIVIGLIQAFKGVFNYTRAGK